MTSDHPIVVIIYGPDLGRKYTIERTCTIGRNGAADLKIDDCIGVSKLHARFEDRGDDGWWIRDLGSTNHTFVNDVRVRDATKLNDGDQIKLSGDVILKFLAREREPESPHQCVYRTRIDGLTGLANKHELFRQLEAAVERRDRIGFILCDLVDFRSVNDRHGHLVGDAILVQVAGRLRQIAGEDAIVARYGGEEFAIVLVDDEIDRLEAIVNEVSVNFDAEPIVVEGHRFHVALHVGYTVVDELMDAVQVVKLADTDLLENKRVRHPRTPESG